MHTRSLRVLFRWWCIAMAAWACSGVFAQQQQQQHAGVMAITEARFLLADDARPPPAEAAWAPVRLPDNWSATRREAQGIGWYRMVFMHDTTQGDSVGILVQRLSLNGEFFVNGVRVLSGGRMDDPVTRNWNTPFFVEVAAPVLRTGPNVLDIRIHAHRNSNGGLGTVQVGDPVRLQARHAWLYAVHVKGAIFSFSVTLVAAFIGIACWWRMGREALYGLFGLAMVAWVLRYANYFVQDVPVPDIVYALVVYSAQGWFFIFFTPFLLRLAGMRWPRLERLLYATGCVGTAGIFAAFQGWVPLPSVVGLWMAIWLPGSATLLVVSTRHARQTRSIPAFCAAAVAWLYVPLTVRELMMTANLAPFDGAYIAHYGGVPLVALICWMLIDKVMSAAGEAARAELARERAAFEERQRITQDMHDGLGLQLNAALRLAERAPAGGQVFTHALQGCLDELRLIVDSSASGTGELLTLLGNLRFRLQPKLKAIGIGMHWHMEAFPDDLVLPPRASLQILRIVQEVVNNTIKHAQAGAIHLEALADARPGHVAIAVRDDGAGFDVARVSRGRGLDGMQQRAAAAGVALTIQSGPAGTSVRIEIPDPRQIPAPPPAWSTSP